MHETAERDDTLQDLSDPALITLWATVRVKVALGDDSSRARYETVRAEYERRMTS